jgi:large subunit ribosomal protein L4
VVDQLKLEKPKTKDFAAVLNNLKIDRSCLVIINNYDETLWKSARNISKVSVLLATESNAGDICKHNKLLFTKDAFLSLVDKNKEGSGN